MNNKKILNNVKSYILITIGLFLYTVSWTIFIIPNNMVGGGVTGISAIIQYCTGFNVSYSYFIINVVLLLVAMKILGAGFGVKSIYAIAITTLFLRVLPELIPQSFIEEMALQNGKLLCSIIGGGISGFGVALTFAEGGSSGGTDIVALIINKYRAISPGRVILFLDIFIIASSLVIPTDGSWASRIATVLYGYVVTGVFSITVDLVTSGTKQSIQIFVFSKNYDKIADRLLNEANRGVTVLDGQGWYSKQPVKVLVVVARKHDSNYLLNLIKDEDPNAFVSLGTVMGVYGQGFDKIKKK